MHQPVSVCHQWSITGTFSMLLGPLDGRRIGALAGEEQRAEFATGRSALSSLPSGSSFLMARKAVGAVNSATALCSAITRQNAPASGVPTGLPS